MTKPETIDYRTFTPEVGGLFCARIFGPVADYECQCGAYRGMKHRGHTCETCGVEVIAARVRRERQGHIALCVPIPHPWRLGEVAAHLGLTVDEVRRRVDREEGPPLEQALAGTGLLLDALPVLPPDLRPLGYVDDDPLAASDLNDLYRRVINRNNRTRRLLELQAPDVVVRNEVRMLFEAIESLMDNARARTVLTGPRQRQLVSLADQVAAHAGPALLAKRSDYSGVAHLAVDPDLDEGVCRIPRALAKELFKPWAYAMLEAWGYAATILSAKRLVESEAPAAMHATGAVAERWPVLVATDRALAGCRVQVDRGDSAAIVVGPALAARLASEVVRLFVPLGARACAEVRALGVVAVADAGRTEGWFSSLVAGADVEAALREGLASEDPVDDPAIRVALGWWPGPGQAPARWLESMLEVVPPPPRS